MPLKPHPFVGKHKSCLEPMCYRPENDPIHDLVDGVDRVTVFDTTKTTPAFQEAAIKDFEIFKPLDPGDPSDPGQMPDDYAQPFVPIAIPEPAVQQTIVPLVTVTGSPLCKGHLCAICQTKWHHEYDCGNRQRDSLCVKCAQQAAADIQRPKSLAEISAETKLVSGSEASAKMLDTTSALILKIKPNGKDLLANWQEIIYDHIKSEQRRIEFARLSAQSGKQLLADTLTEECQKLSPEEIEILRKQAGKRAAGRGRKPAAADKKEQKTETKKAETKLDAKAAREKLYEQLIASVQAKNPKLTRAEIEAKAQRKLNILEAGE